MKKHKLSDSDWTDFGLSDHFESGKFNDWLDLSIEAAKICGADEGSEMEGLLQSLAAACAKLQSKCFNCGSEFPIRTCKDCGEVHETLPLKN